MTTFLHPNMTIAGSSSTVRLYWIAIGLLTLLFLSSILLTFGDLEASYASYTHLGFPTWAVFFNGFAKIFGLAALLHNKSTTLTHFAFAGFLYDLLLAACAHIAQGEIDVLLPLFGLVLWLFAFTMYRRVTQLQGRAI